MLSKHSKKMIVIGAFLLLASLLWMVEPYYTWAQDQNGHPCRIELHPEVPLFDLENMNPGDSEESSITVIKVGSAPAELFVASEWVYGDPEKGEEGSLYEQIEMVVENEGEVVFEGRMSEWDYDSENPSKEDALNLTAELGIGLIEQDDEITLDFRIHLPGPETGNEFQGSTLTTRLVFFTICTNGTNGDDPPPPFTPPPPPPENGDDEPEDPDDPDPEDPDEPDEPDTPDVVDIAPDPPAVSPDPEPEEEIEEEEEETVIIEPEAPRVEPPLPRTDGVSIGLFVFGTLLVMAGISLRRSIREKG